MSATSGKTYGMFQMIQTTQNEQLAISAVSACLSLLLMSVNAMSSESNSPSDYVGVLMLELNLSDHQATAVDQILKKALVNRQEIDQSSHQLEQDERDAAMKAITNDADKQLQDVLTEDQFSKYLALRDQVRREELRRRARDSRWLNR